MVKRKIFSRNKMSWQSNKTKKPPCKSEVEDGEIVDEPSAKLKEISKSATSVTSIDIPKEIQKEDKLSARKEKLVPEKCVKADNSKNVKKPRLSKESFTDLTQDYADSSKPPADDFKANTESKCEKLKPCQPTLGPSMQKGLKIGFGSENEVEHPQISQRYPSSSNTQPLPRFRRKCSDSLEVKKALKYDMAIARRNATARERVETKSE